MFGRSKILSPWALKADVSTLAPTEGWSNRDMDPVPPKLRTWSTWNYATYWISDAANIPAWEVASSMLAIGLSWRQALPAIAIGYTLIAVVITLNGTIGARLHVPFPVLVRSSFGFWFSYLAVLTRIIISMFWFGIQSFSGSECIYQMLKAIWPSTARIPNHLHDSAHVTTAGLMTYFIFWLIQFPFMLVSPQQIRYFFLVKASIVPSTWIGMLIWALVKVPTLQSLDSEHTTLHGTDLNWAYLISVNSALGVWTTLAVNIPDFTRYAKNEKAQYIQLFLIPPLFTFVGFVGIAVTSATTVMYGETMWDPLLIIDRWEGRPLYRAAAFFVAFSFLLATIGANISANSLSAANDMTSLFPRYINIRRGQVICAILGGWALCPWEILGGAPGFINFMSAYTVFLGPFSAIMMADYWVVHRGKVDIPAMYDPHGRYRYWRGVNFRAVVAILCAISPAIPGLIQNVADADVVEFGAISRVFNIDALFGFFTAFILYSACSFIFPPSETFVERVICRVDNTCGSNAIGIRDGLEERRDDDSIEKDDVTVSLTTV